MKLETSLIGFGMTAMDTSTLVLCRENALYVVRSLGRGGDRYSVDSAFGKLKGRRCLE